MPHPIALGAVLSPPDPRDYEVARFNPSAVALARAWDFTGLLQPVRNQGAEGTCVGHAGTTVMGYGQETGFGGTPADHQVLSPRALYEGARQVEPVPGGAEGAYPRAALKYAQKKGVPPEALWPYVPHQPGSPLAGAAEAALRNRVATYSAVPRGSLKAIKEAMYWHGPALAVVNVDEGFAATGADGRIARAGGVLGAHAIPLTGWNDDRKAYRIRNSWGTEWGQRGDADLPYDWELLEVWVLTPAPESAPLTESWAERLFPFLKW